ncbi:MAG: hypothetical protein GY946_01550, partial [bacterium]|nr:hypothetical protein [bacterium]
MERRRRKAGAVDRWRVLVGVLLAVCAVGLIPIVVEGGDPVVAKALLDSARDQLRKRNDDAALALAEKTLAEAPNYLPALEFKGKLLEKLGRMREAGEVYGAWLTAYAEHSAAGTLEKRDVRSKKDINSRLARVTQGWRAFAALEKTVQRDLTGFVAKWKEQAPQAVERAEGLIEALRGGEEAAETAETGGMSKVYQKLAPASEVDLIARHSLGKTDGLTYLDDAAIEFKYESGGTILQPVET